MGESAVPPPPFRLRRGKPPQGAAVRPRFRTHVAGALLIAIALTATPACRRKPALSDEAYRQAVTSFYVALAAMQTSQDVHARTELERFVGLAPDEPAGWANFGLLLLRQQQIDEAAQRLTRAAGLAPRNAAIERLLALTESRKGNSDQSVSHWRRAAELDPADMKAPYALAQELERLGGAANDAEAQRAFEGLADRSGNLAAQIESARVAARRGDTAALAKALAALTPQSSGWPAAAQERLTAVRTAAAGGATAAATPIVFLKNVLIREPEYRAALAAVSTPRAEVGEPLVRFVTLPNPTPQPAAADEQLTFATQTPASLAGAGTSWAGVVWLTGEGRPTLLSLSGQGLRLDNGVRAPLPVSTPLADPGDDAVAAADLDYDFRTDLAVASAGGLQIFRQDAQGAFTPVLAATKLPADVTSAPMTGVWAADIDTDGDLDLVTALRDGPPRVLRNNGDGSFVVQSPFATTARARGFVWADFDGEGVPDAALLDDQGAVHLYLNLRGGEFKEQQVPAPFPRAAAITAAEADGDGIVDLLGLGADGIVTRLSFDGQRHTFAASRLAQSEAPAGAPPGRARLIVADLDNNGAGDLIVSTATASRVLLATSAAAYRQVGSPLAGHITAAADLDGDGRLELIGRADDGPKVIRSSGAKTYRWQSIRPRAVTATGDQRINSFGIGGEVEVRSGLHAQKQVISTPVVHFGLGDASGAEVARLIWPNGFPQSEFDLKADSTIGASQRLKGSCPWLFAWNGREMGFVTDFIWRSPLGLRINAQATADVQMTEDWVRIRGDQLAARDGKYELSITAELWESHFFDLVSLLVVDHPAGTEVFVDERFAVPAPPLGVTATAPLQPFASVQDDAGRDVRDIVSTRDDRHLDFAGRGRYQGVTRQHFIEMELPAAAPRTGPLWLVGQGWVHPTDSSINVALGQGSHAPPSGLALQVADRSGRFKTVRPALGFPAGKDKTVLIDLAGVFAPGAPRRIRLVTNLEIFWDRLAWTAGRPDVPLTPRKLPLSSAALRFRGYSATEQKDASTPERPRYVVAGVQPRWRDLEGFHTRFGDVRELLLSVDDRYVIMNAGDEMTLTFPEAPPPAPGFIRDFVLVGDGWEKDGDFNTVASRTVLPLPTHRSAKYVPGSGRLEDDPIYQQHREDFERYHTRWVSPEPMRDALRLTGFRRP